MTLSKPEKESFKARIRSGEKIILEYKEFFYKDGKYYMLSDDWISDFSRYIDGGLKRRPSPRYKEVEEGAFFAALFKSILSARKRNQGK